MIQYVDLLSDTICAPITAPGYAGVSVIRVSGERAVEFTRKVAPKLPSLLETHKSYFLRLKNIDGELVDESLVTFFEKKRSFTGDETIEVSCHGNPLLVNQIIDLYLAQGARAAERGEFSFRAFYNGKMDLVQAESIHEVVTNNSSVASLNSLQQLTGNLSDKFRALEEGLVLAMSHLEATIDFVEQDIDPEDYKSVAKKIEILKKEVEELVETYDVGKNLNGGHKILLLGATNVGKSSLFNCLFNEERAIVTDVAGTTRDLVRGQKFLGNNSVEFIDSAGIRESSDKIEQIGIQKSLDQANEASLIVYVFDRFSEFDIERVSQLPLDKTVVAINKMDLLESAERATKIELALKEAFGDSIEGKVFRISTLKSLGIEDLQAALEKHLIPEKIRDEKVVISQARQFNHLSRVNESLTESLRLIKSDESPDLISQELSLGLMEIHQLLGKEYNDEVLDKIFSDFCIGK